MTTGASNGDHGRDPGLDWLRVLAFFLMVPYHVSLVFTMRGWLVASPEQSVELARLMRIPNYFRVPLLFFVSGFVLAKVLSRRPAGAVVRDRILRLGVPLAFGTLVIVPPQRFFGWLARRPGAPPAELLAWSFTPASFFRGNFAWHHLWFLAYLLVFSLAVVVARDVIPWARVRDRVGTRGVLAVLVVLLVAFDLAFEGWTPARNDLLRDWANVLSSLAVFAAGFGLGHGASAERFWDEVVGLRWFALIVAIGATVALDRAPPVLLPNRAIDHELVALRALRALNVVAWLVLLLGLARTHLGRRSRFLTYCNEAVLPWYVIHQTVVVTVAWACLSLALPVWPKFLVEVALSLAGTALVYEVAIRRFPIARFLLGQRPPAPSEPRGLPLGRVA